MPHGKENGSAYDSQKDFQQIQAVSSSAPSHTPDSLRVERTRVTGETVPFLGLSMHNGYVRIWRKIENSAIFKDAPALHLFMWFLIKAQHEDDKYSCIFKGQQIYLKKGECVFGRKIASDATGLPESTVRNALDRLEKLYRIITTKRDNKKTVVTILNWLTYQNDFSKRDNNETTTRQQRDTKQEHKNIIINNKDIKLESTKEKKPESLETCRAYFKVLGFEFEADKFFDHFETSGWVRKGGQKIVDWKSAARNWVRGVNEGRFSNGKSSTGSKDSGTYMLPSERRRLREEQEAREREARNRIASAS